MEALRPEGLLSALALIAGAGAAQWFWRRRSALAALLAMTASVIGLQLALAHAQVDLARPATRDLAEIFKAQAKPGDRVFHYAGYFHDFNFYAGTEVGLVNYVGELEIAIDPVAQASGRFLNEPAFRQQWTGSGRIWAVARKELTATLFADPAFRYYLLGESRSHYLFSNQP
jgi:hypothetical protein